MAETDQIDTLLDYNRRNHGSHIPVDSGKPRFSMAVVRCMDHRINLSDVLGISAGDVDEIANAGGVVTDDVLRSLAVSQRLKGTTAVIVIGHTGCGMTSFDQRDLKEQIRKEVGTAPTFDFRTFADVADNVAEGVEAIKNCPFLPHRTQVRGYVLDLQTGLLNEVEVTRNLSGRPRANLIGR